ncbi:hypothetical protein [Thiothrix nivea]|nr:hypothetical protein [Thiothrix nivea]
MSKWLFRWVGLVFLSACAPQYETRYELTPPTSTAGLACLNRCQTQTQACNQQCSQQYAQCGVQAGQQAKLALPGQLKDYDSKLNVWQNDMERYESDLRFYEMEVRQREVLADLNRFACDRDGKDSASCVRHPSRLHSSWLYEPRSPGSPPSRPTLESETARIRNLSCSQDCKCDGQYRQCYASCGGTVKPYQFCTDNCPTRQ